MRNSNRTPSCANALRFSVHLPWRALLLSFLAKLCVVAGASGALNPSWTPGKNFDLSHWHLTLPDADATTIKPSTLTGGYTNASWFYTGADGAMVFYCPVNGGTTDNSQYPRTELRERIDPADTAVNWTYRGRHILEAQCKVLQAPSSGQLWFGQIHGYLSNGPALFLLRYSNGVVEAHFRTNPAVTGAVFLPITNVGLNELISYRIEFADGLLTASVNGATQRIDVVQSNAGWTNQTFYFKAGSYCRDFEGPVTEGARVAFYSLEASHLPSLVAPVLTLQPADQAVGEGASATFRVRAQGTAPLSFRWRKDGVEIPSATSSNLTLANITLAQAGQYSVSVSNVVGTVVSTSGQLLVLPVTNRFQPPGSNFDLSHWYLTLPDENATIVPPADLAAGYTNNPWFYTGADGAMTFWSPVNGGTTENSTYPRSELREMLDPLDTSVNWSVFGTHVLDAQSKILQVPSTERVVIGQIHAFLDSAPALCLIKYSRGTIEAQIKMTPDDTNYARLTLLTNVLTNTLISYQIKVTDGLLSVAMNGATQSVDILAADASWTNQSFYFKAGSYVQDNVGTNSEGSRVAFYQLSTSHEHAAAPPFIAKQPLNQETNTGATVSFRTLVTGTPPLFFQWHKDGEPLPAITNSLLVISNALPTNAGLYHCVITNGFGAVTSAVASLSFLAGPPPAVAVYHSAGKIYLQWTMAPGRSYRIFARDEFLEGEWIELSLPVVVIGPWAICEDDATSPKRFYRIVVE